MSTRILWRVLIPTLASAAAFCLAAGSAEAKAGLAVSATPVTVHGSATGLVSVSASGGDDAAGLQRLCLQQSAGAGWHTIKCGAIGLGNGGTVRIRAQRSATRTEYFRAQLWRVERRKTSGSGVSIVEVVDLTSSTVRVPPARQPHTKSRSVVSFRSVETGIATASVVRSK